MNDNFLYEEAFSRNLGWLSESELQILKQKKVAIAGCGGVGGHYAEALTRLGITRFVLADFDEFEIQNFNRQNCSGMSSIGQKKIEILSKKILDINPEAEITKFSDGVYEKDFDQFFENVDIYLDGLDFYAIEIRIKLFNYLTKQKIPAITVAPAGMGAACVIFTPNSMSFSQYFGMNLIKQDKKVNIIKFLIGLAPSFLHSKYIVDKTKMDIDKQKAPSTPMGCYLACGVAVTNALKILLNRGQVLSAPWSLHYDAYSNKYKKSYIFWGHKNPAQLLKFFIAMRSS